MLGFLKSKDGEKAIGEIMLKAISQSLEREIRYEDGKSEPGKTIEKTKRENILDHIAFYMPHVEGALRGVQVDTAKSNNKIAKTHHILIETLRAVQKHILPGLKDPKFISNVQRELESPDNSGAS